MRTQEQFWATAESLLAEFDLLKHPFYQAWSCGELTLEDLRQYAGDYYHHVAAFPAYLTALHSRLPDGTLRRRVLANAAGEELHGRPHSELWLQFAAAVGADCDDVRAGSPTNSVAELMAAFLAMARSAEPVTALAAFYAYESQVPRVAKEKSAGLRRWYGLGDDACAYFDLHVTADEHHSRVWKEAIDSCLTAGASEDDALKGIRRGAAALCNALDGIESKRLMRSQAAAV